MAEVGSAFLSIIPSARGFGARLSSEVSPEMDSAGKQAGSRFGGAFASSVKWGSIALAGLGVAGVKAGLETAASMENAKIAFTTMLGSAQKAGAFIKDLGAFAAKTPFEFPELQTAASSLISAGVQADKVIPIMRTLGDVTSGMGTGSEGIKRATVALQQMNAAGRITGEDLNQLRDAGIPVFDLLASATGKSKAEIVKLAQAGKLGATELQQMMSALETGKGLERFSGLMAKQSKSLGGVWSTFKDNLNMSLSKALTPSLPAIKTGLTAISTALPGVIQGITNLVTPLVALGKFIFENKPLLAGLAAVMLTAMVPSLVAATIATWSFTAALLANPLTWIAILIGLVVAAVVLLITHWDLIKQKTGEVWDWITAKLAAAWNWIKTASSQLWTSISQWISQKWDEIRTTVVTKGQAVIQWFRDLPSNIMRLLAKAGSWLLKVGEDIVNGLIKGIGNGFAWVKKKIQELGGNITGWARSILHIGSPSKVMADEVGRWIPAGIAMGIDSHSSMVHDSMIGLTSGLSSSARLGAVSVGSSSFSAASSSDRPIRMSDGTLFGWVRSIANGEAELVLNKSEFESVVYA